jgi:hypothetical protein
MRKKLGRTITRCEIILLNWILEDYIAEIFFAFHCHIIGMTGRFS